MSKYILISLLTTSSDEFCFLVESINCIKQQIANCSNEWVYEIAIVVNQQEEDESAYAAGVRCIFNKHNIQVIQTLGNGLPGMGHNSVYKLFETDDRWDKYDYMIPLDGDDFLYPGSLFRLETYITTHSPDVCILPYSDCIANVPKQSAITHTLSNTPPVYLYHNTSYTHHQIKAAWINTIISPFTISLKTIRPGGRIILVSRRAALIQIRFNEQLFVDDIHPFIQLANLALHSFSQYRIFMLPDMDIFIYNRLKSRSTSVSQSVLALTATELRSQHKILRQSLRNVFKHSIRLVQLWTINAFPFIVPNISTITFQDKCEFALSLAQLSE